MPAPIIPILIGAAVIGGAMLLGKKGAAHPPTPPAPKKPTPLPGVPGVPGVPGLPGTVPFPVPGVPGMPGPGGYTAPPFVPPSGVPPISGVPGWPPTWWPGKEIGTPPPLPPLPGTFPGSGGTTGPIPGTTTGPTTAAPDDGVAGLPEPLKTTTVMAMSTATGNEGANGLDGLALELDRMGQHKAAYEVRARSNEVRKAAGGGTASAAPTLGAEDYGVYTDKNKGKWKLTSGTSGWSAESSDYLPAIGSLFAMTYEALIAEIDAFAGMYMKTSVSGNLGDPALQYPGTVGFPGGYAHAWHDESVPHDEAAEGWPHTSGAGGDRVGTGAMTIPLAATMRMHADPRGTMMGPRRAPLPPEGSADTKLYQFGYQRGRDDFCNGQPYNPNSAVVSSDIFRVAAWSKSEKIARANYVRAGYEHGYRAARDEGCGTHPIALVPQQVPPKFGTQMQAMQSHPQYASHTSGAGGDRVGTGAMAVPLATTMRSHARSMRYEPGRPVPITMGGEWEKAYSFGYRAGYDDFCNSRPYYPNGAVVKSDVFRDLTKSGWSKEFILDIAGNIRHGYEDGYRAARDEGCGSHPIALVPQQVPPKFGTQMQYAWDDGRFHPSGRREIVKEEPPPPPPPPERYGRQPPAPPTAQMQAMQSHPQYASHAGAIAIPMQASHFNVQQHFAVGKPAPPPPHLQHNIFDELPIDLRRIIDVIYLGCKNRSVDWRAVREWAALCNARGFTASAQVLWDCADRMAKGY